MNNNTENVLQYVLNGDSDFEISDDESDVEFEHCKVIFQEADDEFAHRNVLLEVDDEMDVEPVNEGVMYFLMEMMRWMLNQLMKA